MEVALLVSLTPHDIRRVEVCVQLVIMDLRFVPLLYPCTSCS